LSRNAIRCAISGDSFFICESAVSFTTTGCLLIASCTVNEFDVESINVTVPATLRKLPKTISLCRYFTPVRVARATGA